MVDIPALDSVGDDQEAYLHLERNDVLFRLIAVKFPDVYSPTGSFQNSLALLGRDVLNLNSTAVGGSLDTSLALRMSIQSP